MRKCRVAPVGSGANPSGHDGAAIIDCRRAGPRRCPGLPIGEPGTALDVPASDEADAMSKGDIFLLALAVLAAVVAVGAAIESNWLSVAVFSGLVVSNLVMLMQFRRRRRREL